MSLVDIKIGEKVLVKSVQSLDQLLKKTGCFWSF